MEKKKILIIEDDSILQKALREFLEAEGFETLNALNGEDGARIGKSKKPDLILLDIIMPMMPGTKVAEELLNHKATKDIPIIFVTAIVKRGELGPRDDKIGGRYFIFKPVKLDELLIEIENRLGS